MARRQERRLLQRHGRVVVHIVGRGVVLQEPAHVLTKVGVGRDADTDLRQLRGDIERARAPEKVVRRPAALHAETVERSVPRPETKPVPWRLDHAHHHPDAGIAGRRRRVRQYDVDRPEQTQPVQVALRQVELLLAEPVPWLDRKHPPYRRGVDLLRSIDQHLPHPHLRPGKRFQRGGRPQRGDVDVVVAQDVGVRIALIPQPAHDRIAGGLEQQPVEGVANLERQVALQARQVENPVEPLQLERRQPHRIPFVEAKLDIHVPALALDQRVHDNVHIAALTVQQHQPDDVAAELELVERPLLPESHPAQEWAGRERAGIRGHDRRAERVVVDGVITLEGKATDHPFRLLLCAEWKGGHRKHGDEQSQRERAQLTQPGCFPMLARSPCTVNLFDT